MNNVSVGDLAAQIMAQDALPQMKASAPSTPSFEEDTSFYSPNVTEQSPDISEVEVPNDFVNNLLEGKDTPVPLAPVKTISEPISEPISETTDLQALVKEVRDLLAEVKTTLVEMTAVGSIGVNMAGPGQKEDEEEEEKDPMKAMLKRIKSRRASK